jgi:biopolymer transport protein ExbB
MYFRKIKVDEETMISRLKATLEKGHYDEALSICEANPSPSDQPHEGGDRAPGPPSGYDQEHGHRRRQHGDPQTGALPLHPGDHLQHRPPSRPFGDGVGEYFLLQCYRMLAGLSGDKTALAGGIAGALVTTAVGIVVSIPAIIFYNYLVAKVNHIIIRLENRVNELVLYLGKAQNRLGVN